MGEPLTNEERRDVLDRLGPPPPIVGIQVFDHSDDGAFVVDGWDINVWDSADDRDYMCASCGSVLRARGIVVEGTFTCCGQRVLGYEPAPPRRRGHPRP